MYMHVHVHHITCMYIMSVYVYLLCVGHLIPVCLYLVHMHVCCGCLDKLHCGIIYMFTSDN